MVSIFTKRLPILPLLIAGQSICGAAPTESASIGNAGRVYPRAGGLRSRRCHRASRAAADHLFVETQKKTKRHACAGSSTLMSSPSRFLMRASP
jgi:hypothetical protein